MIRICPLYRSATKIRPSSAKASAVGQLSPVYAASKVPDVAAAGRDSTTITDRRKKMTKVAARALGERSRIRPRSRPRAIVVFDAPRETGRILFDGRRPRANPY